MVTPTFNDYEVSPIGAQILDQTLLLFTQFAVLTIRYLQMAKGKKHLYTHC